MATASTMQDQEEKTKEEKLLKYLGIALDEFCNVKLEKKPNPKKKAKNKYSLKNKEKKANNFFFLSNHIFT